MEDLTPEELSAKLPPRGVYRTGEVDESGHPREWWVEGAAWDGLRKEWRLVVAPVKGGRTCGRWQLARPTFEDAGFYLPAGGFETHLVARLYGKHGPIPPDQLGG